MRIFNEDLGLPNWRVFISMGGNQGMLDNQYSVEPHLRVENFKFGFMDGEQWDEMFIYSKGRAGVYRLYISYLTTNPSKIEEYKKKLLEEFPSVIQDMEIDKLAELSEIMKELNEIKSLKESDLYLLSERGNIIDQINE